MIHDLTTISLLVLMMISPVQVFGGALCLGTGEDPMVGSPSIGSPPNSSLPPLPSCALPRSPVDNFQSVLAPPPSFFAGPQGEQLLFYGGKMLRFHVSAEVGIWTFGPPPFHIPPALSVSLVVLERSNTLMVTTDGSVIRRPSEFFYTQKSGIYPSFFQIKNESGQDAVAYSDETGKLVYAKDLNRRDKIDDVSSVAWGFDTLFVLRRNGKISVADLKSYSQRAGDYFFVPALNYRILNDAGRGKEYYGPSLLVENARAIAAGNANVLVLLKDGTALYDSNEFRYFRKNGPYPEDWKKRVLSASEIWLENVIHRNYLPLNNIDKIAAGNRGALLGTKDGKIYYMEDFPGQAHLPRFVKKLETPEIEEKVTHIDAAGDYYMFWTDTYVYIYSFRFEKAPFRILRADFFRRLHDSYNRLFVASKS